MNDGMFLCYRLPKPSFKVIHSAPTQNKIAVDGERAFIAPDNKICIQEVLSFIDSFLVKMS